jgi:hypothetical protein
VLKKSANVLLIQITDQLNHNKGLKDWEQLYRVENTVGDGDWAVSCNRPLPESVAELPQVEELALWCGMGGCYVDLNGTAMYMSEGLMLPGTLETLGAKCIDGRLSPHTGEEGVIIPVSFAKKYFGETMVAGRGIQLWKESKQLTVIGVYEDFPKNCDVENVVVTATSYDFCTTGMVAFVNAGDNDKIEFENCTVSNVKLYAPNVYTAHAAVYTTGSNTLFDEVPGVTVTNVTFENI